MRAGRPAGRRPVRWRGAPPRPRADPRRAGAHRQEHGIEHVGVAPADVLERARSRPARASRRRAWRLAWGSRTATLIGRPIRRGPWPAPGRSWWPPARTSPTSEPARPPGVQARVARYAWVDHYAPLRAGLRAMARRLRAADHRAVAFADDNSIVDREVAYRAGLGWFGKNANLLLPGRRQLVRARLRRHHGAAAGVAAPVRRRLRLVPRCLDALPDRGDRRPGRGRRQPLPRLGAAAPGCHPGRAPAGGRRPHLRLRRLPGGVPADRPPRAAPSPAAATPTPEPWVDVLDLLGRRRRDAARAPRAVVHRRPRSALAAAQRAGHPRQHGADPADPRGRRPRWPATAAGDDAVLAEHARWAQASSAARAVAATIASSRRRARRSGAVKHLLVTNDFPPKIGGIQSLLWEWWRRLPPDRSPC